uniref:P-type ATPase N-terminal domain-containing protein n=1 Tax=Fundulus heteroclitus TaxID=8078 RepID=A0A3Q2PNS2_FUNHE
MSGAASLLIKVILTHFNRFFYNRIRTTKYSFLSFLPKNLFEQLHRFANVYFIFLAALNFVPVVEAFQPEVSLIPICLVLAVTAIKDIFEDYRRFKSDRFINNLPCQVYSRGRWPFWKEFFFFFLSLC